MNIYFAKKIKTCICTLVLSLLPLTGISRTGQPPELRSSSTQIILPIVDGANIRIEYPVLVDCPQLVFEDAREIVHQKLRAYWRKTADSCGELTPSGISTQGCQLGQSVVVLAPNVYTAMKERVYPTATPIKGVGTLVHTGAIATNGACKESRFEFTPPVGGAVTMARLSFESSVAKNSDQEPATKEAFVFLGGTAYAADRPHNSFSSDFPAEIKAQLNAAIEKISALYTLSFPNFRTPQVFIGYFDQPQDFGYSFSGDVSKDKAIVRLSFFRDSPIPISDIFQATRFVAHEFAHTTQTSISDDSDPNLPVILEGNADTIALLAVAELNPAWMPRVSEHIEGAVNRCLLEMGREVWRDSPKKTRNMIPYDCGVAFSVAGLVNEGIDPQALPLQRLLKLNAQSVHPINAMLSRDVLTHLQGSAKVQVWLPTLLLGITNAQNARPMDLGRQSKAALASWLIRSIIASDCPGGGAGARASADAFEIVGVKNCKTLKPGMRVVAINGQPLLDSPILAVQSVRDQCNTANRLQLQLAQGEAVFIEDGCKASLPDDWVLSIDASRLLNRAANAEALTQDRRMRRPSAADTVQ